MTTTTEIAPLPGEQIISHSIANGNGESFDTIFNGEAARSGSILPHTDIPDYRVQSPKVLLVTNGTITIGDRSYETGELISPPVNRPAHLQVGAETFTYVSRKASAEIHEDTENRLAQLAAIGIGDTTWWSLPREEQFARINAIVGNTPLEKVVLENGSTVFVKRECDNPSGSHYDRAYFATIKHFEEIGFTQPGDELRDITSGSAGISLALMGYLLGYKARIMVPSELPANRLYPMLRLGARLVDTNAGYVPHASKMQTDEIQTMKEDPAWATSRPADRSGRAFLFSKGDERICYLNHSENELSPLAFSNIADEIAQTVPDASHIALAEGNWTTIAGIAPRLRELIPGVQIVGYSGELTNGATDNFGTNVPDVPIRFKDTDLVDEEVVVTNTERDQMQPRAPRLGRSSLMGLAVAHKILTQTPTASVVTIGYDLAGRY